MCEKVQPHVDERVERRDPDQRPLCIVESVWPVQAQSCAVLRVQSGPQAVCATELPRLQDQLGQLAVSRTARGQLLLGSRGYATSVALLLSKSTARGSPANILHEQSCFLVRKL